MSWTVISQSSTGFKQDRRRSPRLSISVQVELREEGSATPTRVETADLSTGGMYVQMLLAFEIGTRLEIVLWLAGQKHCVQGVVVTKHPQFGNGIEFTHMASDSTAALIAFVDSALQSPTDRPSIQ